VLQACIIFVTLANPVLWLLLLYTVYKKVKNIAKGQTEYLYKPNFHWLHYTDFPNKYE